MAVVVKQKQRLFVLYLARVDLDHIIRMPVGQEKIDVAVVVVIKELQAPAAQQPRGVRNSVHVGYVRKGLVLVVVVEREHLLVYVRHEEILPSVLVKIGGIYSHSR